MKILIKIVYILLVIIESLLILRFIFLLIDANTRNWLVSVVLDVSEIFISPIDNIVDFNWSIGNICIDVDALVSLVIYMVLGFGTSELIKTLSQGD
jgi:hypothetical protein